MRIRSLRNRLALLFGLIVLTAIAIVYFAVAPQLRARCATRSSTASRMTPSVPRRRCGGWSAPTRRSPSSPARCV